MVRRFLPPPLVPDTPVRTSLEDIESASDNENSTSSIGPNGTPRSHPLGKKDKPHHVRSRSGGNEFDTASSLAYDADKVKDNLDTSPTSSLRLRAGRLNRNGDPNSALGQSGMFGGLNPPKVAST